IPAVNLRAMARSSTARTTGSGVAGSQCMEHSGEISRRRRLIVIADGFGEELGEYLPAERRHERGEDDRTAVGSSHLHGAGDGGVLVLEVTGVLPGEEHAGEHSAVGGVVGGDA